MKKYVLPLMSLVILALIAGAVWLFLNLQEQKQVNQDMKELAALDKQEMENEYERFALQYSEMKTQINNDSIVEQLATVRAVLRDYVMQIDSLNRLNENLKRENTRVTAELEQRTQQVVGLSSEKASLSEKVAIAAQLDATNISLMLLDKKDKAMKKPKLKDCRKMQVSFTISRNVTASNGNRTVYVRIQNPGGNVLGGGGTFPFENRDIECSARKVVEYTGEETSVSVYWPVTQMLESGQYRVSIFADGHMIGSRTFNYE